MSALRGILTRSSSECLGLHIGKPQTANLGDGNNDVNQMVGIVQRS